MPALIAIVGKSNSGKTTLVERLLPALLAKGVRVGTIKHTRHDAALDTPGKDSWRHRRAGAAAVLVASRSGISLVSAENGDHPENLLKYFPGIDLVLAEGYKRAACDKIEVFRSAAHERPACLHDTRLIAMVSDDAVDSPVPRFGLDQIGRLADFIVQRCAGRRPAA